MSSTRPREFIQRGIGIAAATALANPLEQLAAATTSQRKPNVLFSFADQMRAQSLGCLGNADVHTLATPAEWKKRFAAHCSPRLMRGMEEQ